MASNDEIMESVDDALDLLNNLILDLGTFQDDMDELRKITNLGDDEEDNVGEFRERLANTDANLEEYSERISDLLAMVNDAKAALQSIDVD